MSVVFLDQLNTMGCTRHPNGKIVPMRLATVTNKDGSITESFGCPKCFQSFPCTPDLKAKMLKYLETLEQEKKDKETGGFVEKVNTAEAVSISLSQPSEKGGTNDTSEPSAMPDLPGTIGEEIK